MNFKYKTIKYLLFAINFLLILSCQQKDKATVHKHTTKNNARIISLSGFLTEVLSNLGHGVQLVGRDVTSSYPKDLVDTLPNLGHISQLNVEAVLQLEPTQIFIEEAQLKQSTVLDQLKNAGIELVVVPTSTYLNNAIEAASVIEKHLSTDLKKIKNLTNQIVADSLKLAKTLANIKTKPKVLFIYARGAGRLMVAGINTSASAIIEKAGGQNAIHSFENFKALTPEAVLEANPDIILMFETGLASLDGKEGLAQITGIDQTPAFKNNRIIAMDGHYLTAFGPKVGQTALELAQKIHSTE